jgi:hypothetical protein
MNIPVARDANNVTSSSFWHTGGWEQGAGHKGKQVTGSREQATMVMASRERGAGGDGEQGAGSSGEQAVTATATASRERGAGSRQRAVG